MTSRFPVHTKPLPPNASDVMALPEDPRVWTADQVQQWFREYNGGKWARFGLNFSELSGDELCDLTETQILRFVDNDPRGAVVFNFFAKRCREEPAMATYASGDGDDEPKKRTHATSVAASTAGDAPADAQDGASSVADSKRTRKKIKTEKDADSDSVSLRTRAQRASSATSADTPAPASSETAPEQDGFINLRIINQENREIVVKVTRIVRMRKLMKAYCQKVNVWERSVRFLSPGDHVIQGHETVGELQLENNDIIDVFMWQVGDIGVFAQHHNSAGVEFLRGGLHVMATAADALAISTAVGATNPTPFVAYPSARLVSGSACQALVALADARHRPGQADLKIDLTTCELEAMVGAPAVSAMTRLFASHVDEIKVRRVEAGGGDVIGFHTDHSLKTMQIPLNEEGEYEGGRLTFATARGLEQPTRPVGSATVHDNTIAHGVTELTAGVRYSLFLLTLPS